MKFTNSAGKEITTGQAAFAAAVYIASGIFISSFIFAFAAAFFCF